MLQVKSVLLEKTNQKSYFKKDGYVRKQKNSFQEITMKN